MWPDSQCPMNLSAHDTTTSQCLMSLSAQDTNTFASGQAAALPWNSCMMLKTMTHLTANDSWLSEA